MEKEIKISEMPKALASYLMTDIMDPYVPVILRNGANYYENYKVPIDEFSTYILDTVKSYGYITKDLLNKIITNLNLSLYITLEDLQQELNKLDFSKYVTKSDLQKVLEDILLKLSNIQNKLSLINYTLVKAFINLDTIPNTNYLQDSSYPPNGWQLSTSSFSKGHIWEITARQKIDGTFYKWANGNIWTNAICINNFNNSNGGNSGGGNSGGSNEGGNSEGNNRLFVEVFKYSLETPSKPTGGIYNYSTNKLTIGDHWLDSIIGLNKPIWRSTTTFTSENTNTGWSEPTLFISDGKDLLYNLTISKITIYKEQTTEPNRPIGGKVDFSNTIPIFKNCPTGWTEEIGTLEGKNTIWFSVNNFASDGTDTGWTIPMKYNNILAGNYTKSVVERIYSSKTTPCSEITYNFNTKQIEIPSYYQSLYSKDLGSFLYYFIVTFYSDGTNNWSSYIPLGGSYYDIEGVGIRVIAIYKVSPSTPPKPTGGSYDYTSDAFNSTGLTSGWSTKPTSDSNGWYSMRVFYKNNTATEWSDPKPASTADVTLTEPNLKVIAKNLVTESENLDILVRNLTIDSEILKSTFKTANFTADDLFIKSISTNITGESLIANLTLAIFNTTDKISLNAGGATLDIVNGHVEIKDADVSISGNLAANGLDLGTGENWAGSIYGLANVPKNGIVNNEDISEYYGIGSGYLANGNLRWYQIGLNKNWEVAIKGNIIAEGGEIAGWTIGQQFGYNAIYSQDSKTKNTLLIGPSTGILNRNNSSTIYELNPSGKAIFSNGNIVFESNGSGRIGNDISWDNLGKVSLGSNVILSWKDDIKNIASNEINTQINNLGIVTLNGTFTGNVEARSFIVKNDNNQPILYIENITEEEINNNQYLQNFNCKVGDPALKMYLYDADKQINKFILPTFAIGTGAGKISIEYSPSKLLYLSGDTLHYTPTLYYAISEPNKVYTSGQLTNDNLLSAGTYYYPNNTSSYCTVILKGLSEGTFYSGNQPKYKFILANNTITDKRLILSTYLVNNNYEISKLSDGNQTYLKVNNYLIKYTERITDFEYLIIIHNQLFNTSNLIAGSLSMQVVELFTNMTISDGLTGSVSVNGISFPYTIKSVSNVYYKATF